MSDVPDDSVDLARELALVGAESAVLDKDRDPLDGEAFARHGERFRALGARMRGRDDDPRLARLRAHLGLPEHAAWLVLCCAAAERHPEAAAAFSILAEDERVHLPTPLVVARLLHAALGAPFEEALQDVSVGGPADRLGLVERVEVGLQRPWSWQPLRLSVAEARRQLAGGAPGEELTGLDLRVVPPAPAPALPRELVRNADALLREHRILCARSGAARVGRQLGIDLAAHRGREAFLVLAGDEPPDAAEVARLRGGLVVLDLFAPCQHRGFPDALLRGMRERSGAAGGFEGALVLVPPNAQVGDRPVVDLDEHDLATRRRIWRLAGVEPATADALAPRFRVSLDEVRGAASAAALRGRLRGDAGAPDARGVAAEVLAQGARRMGRAVSLLRTAGATLDALVAPESVRATMRDLLDSHRASHRVFEEWGVGRRSPLGRGLSCLFSGPPGTGKTFAAQCIAGSLELNLYRVDLSQVVSKYIGETEKALARVFDEAEAGHGILLFDEADALFGKRNEVKDAHDRYANVEVAYLLQRMESFEGVSILTTNLRSNIDTAFLRRLRFAVEFPMPDASMRAALWDAALPPRERWHPELDLAPFVERFPLSGGNIQTLGVAAAHLAAAQPDGLLRTEHLVRATWRELEKLGVARAREDFGPLARHLPAGPGGRR